MKLYRIWIASEPDSGDTRPWPNGFKVRFCLHKMNFAPADVGLLMAHEPISEPLSAEFMEKFHILRRQHGCCPRIKWEVMK